MRKDQINIHNKSWFRSIFEHGKWYLLASVFTKGINILLLPVFTRYLSPGEYGILGSLSAVGQLLPILVSLYLDSAFGRFFHDVKNNHEDTRKLFSTIFIFVSVFGSLVVVLSLLTAQLWMPQLLKVPVWPYAFLSLVPPLFLQLGQLGIVFLRQSLQARQTTLVEMASVVITLVVTLPLLIGFNMGVSARLLGSCASAAFLAIFYATYFYRYDLLRWRFDSQLLKRCLLYSVPLIPNVAGGWIAGLSDRLVLAKYSTLEAVGIFSLAYQLAAVLYIVQDAITQVQGPISMSGLIYDKEATKEKIPKFLLFILSLMLLCHVGLVFYSQEIIAIFTTKDYHEAYKVLGIIGFVYVISSTYRIFTDIVSYHKRTWFISSSGIMMGVINLGINLMFVPQYGYYASAYALIISVFAYTAGLFWLSQRLEKIKYPWKKILKVLSVYLLSILLAYKFILGTITPVNELLKASLFLVTAFLMVYYSSREYYEQIVAKVRDKFAF